jgi:hypothetical protein
VVRGWGTIARKAAGPVGYWLVLGLITFLGMNAIIKVEATRTRLFLVVVVVGVAFGAASLVEHLLRDYVPTDMQPNSEPTDVWPRWYRRPPHAPTLRQLIRIRFAIFKKGLQLRRPLTEPEMLQVVSVVLDETKILFQSIGALSVAWAQVETLLDYFNGVLILHKSNPELELPKSLKPKIGFFRNAFDRTPELAPFRERAVKIVSELNRLKTIRHDAIHGVAFERMPVGTHKVTRLIYKGKDITQMHTTYSLPDIAFAANDALALLQELNNLFRDVFYVLAPDQAKQVFG